MRRFAVAFLLFSWTLLGQGGFSGPGRYQITNLKSGKVLDLDRNDQTTIIQFSSRGTDNQTWQIQPGPDGFFFIRNGMNGKALDAGRARNSEPLLGMPFNGGPSQQWRFERGKDGNALIISRLGPTIDVPDGSSRDGLRIQVYGPNGDSNQRFMLTRVGGGGAGFRGGRGPDRGFDGGRSDNGRGAALVCESNNGRRVYCETDMRGREPRLVRQISGSPCRQGETWGWDRRGIWVDRGCRAEFAFDRASER